MSRFLCFSSGCITSHSHTPWSMKTVKKHLLPTHRWDYQTHPHAGQLARVSGATGLAIRARRRAGIRPLVGLSGRSDSSSHCVLVRWSPPS